MNKQGRITKSHLLHILKIAAGSSLAIYLAEAIGLQNGASAGTIALLTIVTTKWETVRLSWYRLITFVITVVLSWLLFANLPIHWEAYGIFIFLMAVICEIFGWKATISVNSVIGVHFLITKDFSIAFILNEFLLVLIGITIALLLNLFHLYEGQRKKLVENVHNVETGLKMVLEELAGYLLKQEFSQTVWTDLEKLEEQIKELVKEACDYQNNTFRTHTAYYVDYFEMRLQQCGVLQNLHDQVIKISSMPKQAEIIANYILYMKDYVVEKNVPQEQIEKLEQLCEAMKEDELPQTREEFEARAILYHILMDLEEFVLFKKRFVSEMDEKQRKKYWEVE